MIQKRTFRLNLESLEHRHLLTAVADIDSDGDIDTVDATGWYENHDGFGNFRKHAFSEPVSQVAVGDLDNDGAPDIAFENGWLENHDAKGDFSIRHAFAPVDGFSASRIKLTDVGADGDLDILLFSGDRLILHENVDQRFQLAADVVVEHLSDAADTDHDGDVDVIARDVMTNSIWFHENLGDRFDVSSWPRSVDSPHASWDRLGTSFVNFADVDGDGWDDIVADGWWGPSDRLVVIENRGNGTFGPSKTIFSGFGPRLSDFDQDGDLDIIAYGPSSFTENLGEFRFAAGLEVDDFSKVAADINGDGVPDFVHDATRWFDGKAGEIHTAGSTPLREPSHVSIVRSEWDFAEIWSGAIGDVDNDGLPELIHPGRSLTGNSLFMFEFSQNKWRNEGEVARLSSHTSHVELQDMNGDGHLDVVIGDFDSYSWLENNGKGRFAQERIILSERIGSIMDVVLKDLNSDGWLDVIYTARGGPGASGGIDLTVKLSNRGNFTSVVRYNRNIGSLDVADIDADGDLDVFITVFGRTDRTAIWFENIDGVLEPPASLGEIGYVFGETDFVDLNLDGQLDFVMKNNAGKIAWASGIFGDPVRFSDGPEYLWIVSIVDIDRDGDRDVLARERNDFVWFENLNGRGIFGPSQPFGLSQTVITDLIVNDIDQNGFPDLFITSSSGSLERFEVRVTGDVNADGVFNSSDLVLIFQDSQFEDGIYRNSLLGHADWNGDSEFDSSDLVFLFQSGTYTESPNPHE